MAGLTKEQADNCWRDGAIADEALSSAWERSAVMLAMPAGSVCLMHTRVGHSSAANVGTRPRRLFIAVYSAEDAIPLSPNPLPSRHEGMMVRGHRTGARAARPSN